MIRTHESFSDAKLWSWRSYLSFWLLEVTINSMLRKNSLKWISFARGAYTARALAGMLHKVGLLPAYNRQQIPFAWNMYKDVSRKGWELVGSSELVFDYYLYLYRVGNSKKHSVLM